MPTYENSLPIVPFTDIDEIRGVDNLGRSVRYAGADFAAMIWKGSWVAGSYKKNDVVRDGDWTMIAKIDTAERPAPQPIGSPVESYPVAPVFSIESNASVIYSGTQFTFTKGGWVKRIRVWVPELTPTTNYRFFVANVTDPANPIVSVIEEPVLVENNWATIALGSTIVDIGTVWQVFIDALNSGASTNVSGGWQYIGVGNALVPTAGQWALDAQRSRLRVAKIDLDTDDRTSELLGAIPNSIFSAVETGTPTNNDSYLIASAGVEIGDYIEYPIVVRQAFNGDIPVNATCTIDIEVPVPATTKFVREIDYWTLNACPFANVVGLLEFDGVPQAGADNDAFGVDLQFQEASVSTNWDLVALSAGVSGGGGGGGAGGGIDQIIQELDKYEFGKWANVPVAGLLWEQIGAVPFNVPLGKSTFEVSCAWDFICDATNRDTEFRISIDNGVTWKEYQIRNNNANNFMPWSFLVPVEFDTTSTYTETILFEAKRNSPAIVEITSLAIIVKQVKIQ